MRKFAFLIHPRGAKDVGRRIGSAIGIGETLGMMITPKKLVTKTMKHLKGRFGFTICSKFNVFDQVEGYIIAVLLTAEQMVSLPRVIIRQRILDSVLYAQNVLGVDGVGLGAYTAPITMGGKWLTKQQGVKVWITHGDAYSVALAIEGIKKISTFWNINLKTAKTAIIGAYGMIGSAVTQELIPKCGNLILIGRKKHKFANLFQQIQERNGTHIVTSDNIQDAREADLIITATTDPSSILTSDCLKKNAIVYDIAQPNNLRSKVCIERPDIIRIDGSYAYIDGINIGFKMGPPVGATFGCLAETMMQSLMGDQNSYVGNINMEHLHKTQNWANEVGFRHAQFTNFSKLITIPNAKIPRRIKTSKRIRFAKKTAKEQILIGGR